MQGKHVAWTLPLMLAAGGLAAGCGPTTYQPSPAEMEEAASARSPVIGQRAPAFSLLNQDEETVTLDQLRGRWVVLYFYPKDETPGCACQAEEFTALLEGFERMNATIYGVSEDSPAAHRAFRAGYEIDLDLLSDPEHNMMRRYGVWVDTRIGDKQYERAIRTTMILGPGGVIRYHWPEVIPTGHAQRVHDMLTHLQQKHTPSRQ